MALIQVTVIENVFTPDMNRHLRRALGAALILAAGGCGPVTGNPAPRQNWGAARSEPHLPHRDPSWRTAGGEGRITPGPEAAPLPHKCDIG